MDPFAIPRPPADRPLLGRTILVVEDSLMACEAMRLLGLRSGARMRRAGDLAQADRHLKVWRPSAVIVDIGLPDGSGADLIGRLAAEGRAGTALIGTSGDPGAMEAAMEAGADGFIAKPVSSLAVFQEAVLAHLPPEAQPRGPRALPSEVVDLDPDALADDLAHVADLIGAGRGRASEIPVAYLSQFLASVARDAGDGDLAGAAVRLAAPEGPPLPDRLATLRGLVAARIPPAA
ncbi:MAG: response regulator [Hasllibacter sp.]